MEYNLTLTLNPSLGILSDENNFIYLENRIGQITNFIKNSAIKHIEFLEIFKKEKKLQGFLQIRRLFFNDKSAGFECTVDFLIDYSDNISEIELNSGIYLIEGIPTDFDIEIKKCSFASDHFHKNHKDFYMNERVMPWTNEVDNYIFKRNYKNIEN